MSTPLGYRHPAWLNMYGAARFAVTAGIIGLLVASTAGVATAQPTTPSAPTPTGAAADEPSYNSPADAPADPCAPTSTPSTTSTAPTTPATTVTPQPCAEVPGLDPQLQEVPSSSLPEVPLSKEQTAVVTPSEVPSTGEKIPYTGLPTENPNSTIVPGKMRSDREELPEGFTKEEADLAEVNEYKLQNRQRTARAAADCQQYWPSFNWVCGAIRDKYNSLGAQGSFLLWPTSDELVNPDGFGRRQTFQNGPIYWSAAGGAHPVVNHFFAAWQRNGWEGGVLKYPTSDEIVNPDGVGRRQEFQGGTIQWRLNEAYFVGGAIRDKWWSTGAETNGSLLGYPTSDEILLPDGQGRMNRFERGVIYWHGSTGAHPVVPSILDKWASSGYERGTYGYPSADQLSTDQNVTVQQQFQRGAITVAGPAATELAFLNPGTTAEQQIAAAQQWAQQQAAPVIDVLVEAVRKARQYTQVGDSPSGDDYKDLPDARGKGDIFYADSSLDIILLNKIVNHGHNGIYVSTTNTVEASQSSRFGNGVHEVDNRTADDGARRQVRNPQLGWVNTSDSVRTSAVSFARSKIGKGYNSNFAWNRNVEDEQYNCSQIIWAAYMSASGGSIDIKDGFPNPTPSVYPKELFSSDWVTAYYP
ncbi:hypothetical protein HQO82_04245 [Rhodococcus fascians]|nr:hypothetical protein [Rhodococcus fascians]MBY4113022.1 hypothetical protein [Rhodococcus fascians]